MKSLLNISIEQLSYLEQHLEIDIPALKASAKVADRRKLSYLLSYPHIIKYFEDKNAISLPDLIIGGNFTYGWMPTALAWKTNNFQKVVDLLNIIKLESKLLNKEELVEVKKLVNGSIVGTSKLLHFVNPQLYPIWDSKVNKLLSEDEIMNTNSIDLYFEYYSIFQRLKNSKKSSEIATSIGKKIGYDISFARAFEIILFFSSKETLEESKKHTPSLPVLPKVPKYKRDEFIFISNLAKFTASTDYPITYKRDGYLLSEHYMSKSKVKLANEVKKRRNLLISDNGNFSRIKKIAGKYDDKGLDILSTAKKDVIDTGNVSSSTHIRRKELMDLIAMECKQEVASLDISEITTKQLSINPDYMIGMEDYTIPSMMLCNLMHPIFNPIPKDVLSYQASTLSLYKEQENGGFGNYEMLQKTTNFLVLHAYDYDSAFQAASLSRNEVNKGIAISYGGPMLSKRWISSLKIGNHLEVFDEKLPESYLIAQSLTLGIINGNNNKIPFHILGVGTPILIALIGYQLRHLPAISIDSTAPFKDAYAGTLYGDKNAYIKMDMYRVAAFHLIQGTAFTSSTPFFKFFDSKYPGDWDGLRAKMNVTPDMNYKQLAKTLMTKLDLVEEYIPFFSKMRSGDDEMMLRLRICRAGHNFWILKRICQNIINRREDPVAFKLWIEKQIDRYTKVASYKWAKTVEKTYTLTEKFRNF